CVGSPPPPHPPATIKSPTSTPRVCFPMFRLPQMTIHPINSRPGRSDLLFFRLAAARTDDAPRTRNSVYHQVLASRVASAGHLRVGRLRHPAFRRRRAVKAVAVQLDEGEARQGPDAFEGAAPAATRARAA